MTRRLALALGCALFGALAGAAAMVLLYGLWPRLTVDMEHDRPGLLQGFYKGERAGDLTFAWTSERGDLPLPGLDRNVEWTATIRLRGARQDTGTLPEVTILADGLPLATRRTTNEFEDVAVAIPLKPGRVRGLTLSVVSSNTFVPGPGDSRRLGVQVDRIVLNPATRGVFPPRRSVAVAAIGSAVFGAVFGLLGATATTAVGAATVLAVGEAAVLRVGLGPFSTWLGLVDRLAGGIGLALLAIAFAVERWRGERLRNTARFALMFTGSALFLKLLVLVHPDKWLIDALFHAHRLEAVMGGSYFFTSIAPGGYQFPYPVGLYVAALPLSRLVTDHVLLLRLVAAGAEATSCLFLYWMVVRGSGDRLAAAVAVAILQLMPLGFGVLAAANLTQVFGQALAVVAMALAVEVSASRWHPSIILPAATLATLWAFLSHTSTFATLAGMLGASGVLLVAAGQGSARRTGVRLLAVLVAGLTLAVALYYVHFMPTYRAEYARITGEMAGTTPPPASPRLYQPGVSSIAARARMVPHLAAGYYAWPFLVLAGAGLFAGLRERARDPFWLLVCGWLLACAAFLVLGVLTPVDFRHYYAAMPAVAILAARAVVTLWRRGGFQRATAAALAGLGAAIGVNHWLGVLGARLF
jgi:hypothetical protein